jgi:hypothetical protein
MTDDFVQIATRAYTEPREPQGHELGTDREIVGLLVIAGSESGDALEGIIAGRLERLSADRKRNHELLARIERSDPKTARARRYADMRSRSLHRKIERGGEREARLCELLGLSPPERRKLLDELTAGIVWARAERREALLRGRLANNHRPVLIFDCETRTGYSQKLMFGVWRYCVWRSGRLMCIEEGIFHAGDLAKRDLETIRAYRQTHKLTGGVERAHPQANPTLGLIGEQQFVKLLYNRCHKPGPDHAAALVGLNLNFDTSRIAAHWGPSRENKYANGFSLQLRESYADRNGKLQEREPRYAFKHLSSTKALKGFLDSLTGFSGHIIDVRTLMFALTNRGYSLESGCSAFGVKMPGASEPGYQKRDVTLGIVDENALDYCRDDVLATQLLYEKVMFEFDRHPIPLQPSQAYSAASEGKGYLGAFGIAPRVELQPDFPKGVLGQAMSGFYGGRVECKVKGVPVPVSYCDLLSAYTTANALMDLWPLVIARRVQVRDATADARTLIDQLDTEQVLDPGIWKQLRMLVQIAPEGDILPTRGRYDPTSWNIGLNHLHSGTPLWYAIPDVVNAKLLGGRTPKILRAIELIGEGVQDGLRPVKLRGEIPADPHENFFKLVVEQRHERPDPKDDTGEFLKVLANSTGYGIYAEMIREELPATQTRDVLVADWTGIPYITRTRAPERRGDYFFSPMAALITAGTRLLLGIAERLVTDAGGTWAFMDTDSIAIVSSQHGGEISYEDRDGITRTIPVLSWQQVDEIRNRLQSLNPYDGAAGAKPILELEKENFDEHGRRRELQCYAISSKRYALFTWDKHGTPEIQAATQPDQHPEIDTAALKIEKRSDHALGFPINPINPESSNRDYIGAGWEWILRSALELDAPEPEYFKRPLMMRWSVTTPGLERNVEWWNTGKKPRDRIGPMGFLMIATQRPFRHPIYRHSDHIPLKLGALILPYERNPKKWEHATATARNAPAETLCITTGIPGARAPSVRSFRDLFGEYRHSDERKMLGPGGEIADKDTIGLLSRRTVIAAGAPASIGKESNYLELGIVRLLASEDDYLNEYGRPEHDQLDALRDFVHARSETQDQIAAASGVPLRSLERFLAGSQPHAVNRRRISRWAIRQAGAELGEIKTREMTGPAILAAWLDQHRPAIRESAA